ncbi:group II intron maturase-specific domain-containing protein, partial [Alteromonas oceani]
FLGVEIGTKHTRIQAKKLAAFRRKLKQMTKRNGGKPLQSVIKGLNPLLRGFSQYFRIADASRAFRQIASWLRRRLRSVQLKLWKKASRLHRWLRQRGYKGKFVYMNMTSWRSARSPLASYAMPNSWFNELGLVNLEDVRTGNVPSIYAG